VSPQRQRKRRKHRRTKKARRDCQTGKVRFRDEVSARLRISHLRRNSNRQSIPMRPYFCTRCKGWHLTSKTH